MKSIIKHTFITLKYPLSNEIPVLAQEGQNQALYKQVISKVQNVKCLYLLWHLNEFWCFADRASQYNLSNWPT